MAMKRARTGWIRGLSPQSVDALVRMLVDHFADQGGFKRNSAGGYLQREVPTLTERQIEGLLDQLELLAGPRGQRDGFHPFPPNIKVLAKHRRWRLPAGRHSLADTIVLLRCLAPLESLPPGLEKWQARAKEALRHIRVEWRET